MEMQIKFYRVVAVSAGLYGNETWVLIENDKNRIQVAESLMLGVTRQNRLTNEAARKTLKMNNLNDTISKYRGNYFQLI
jgi:hypothetical protein